MMAHPALARLALAVHEQVLGGIEPQAQEVLVAAQEGQMLPHLRHLGRLQPIAAARGGGEAAHLGDDRGRRTRGGGMVASSASPRRPPMAARRMWRGWYAVHAAPRGYHILRPARTRRPAAVPHPACTSRRHLRRLARRRGARAAEGARLESVCTYPVPRVRIPPSPLENCPILLAPSSGAGQGSKGGGGRGARGVVAACG